MITIKPAINFSKFITEAERLFAHKSWFRELIQNALRANATHIKVHREDNDLIFEDNGCGISDEGWEKLITISDSDWDDTVQSNQNPAGIGIFAILLRYHTLIQSNGKCIETTPKDIKILKPIIVKTASTNAGGTTIRIYGAASDYFSANSNINSIKKHEYEIWLKHRPEIEFFRSALYNAKQDAVCLSIPELNIKNVFIKDQTWALQDHDPNRQLTQTIKSITLDHDYNTNVTENTFTAPFLKTNDFYVTLREYNCLSIDAFTNLVFHGQKIYAPRISKAPIGTTIIITIFGKSPINVKHPDRTEIIEDNAWQAFCQNLQLLFDQYKLLRDKATGRLFKSIPALNVCPEVTGDIGNKFYPNEYNKGRQTNAIEFMKEHKIDPQIFIGNNLSEWPEAYNNIDLITQYFPPDTSIAETDDIINPCRILEQVAAEGQVTLANIPAGSDCLPMSDMDPRIAAKLEVKPKPKLGKKIREDKMLESQGSHIITYYDEISVITKIGKFTAEQPLIIFLQTSYSCESGDFIANKAFLDLKESNPEKAFDLFYDAAMDQFMEDEANDMYRSTFDDQHTFRQAKTHFMAESPTKRIEIAIFDILSDMNPEWRYADDVKIKNIVIEDGELVSFEAHATLVKKDKSAALTASLKSGDIEFRKLFSLE